VKTNWGIGSNQVGLAETFPVLISTFMFFKEGHKNSQEGRKRPQNVTYHAVTPLSHFASYLSNTRDRYVELITSGPIRFTLGERISSSS